MMLTGPPRISLKTITTPWTDLRGPVITDVTYYRWRQEFGGMSVSQAKRLKELEKEDERLRKAVSGLTLDKMILKEAAKGNF
jgi:hypothetical protein